MRIAAVVLALVLVGCKSGKEDKVISENLTQVQNGVYQTCSYDSADGVSFKEYVFVSDTYILEGGAAYVGSGCTGTELYNMKMYYSLLPLGSHNYRIRIEGATVNAVNSAIASEFSNIDFCGITTWATNTPYSMIGRDCGENGETLQIGDEQDITAGMLGTNLRVISQGNKFTYTSLNAMNFANSSQTLVNGDYAYYDGTNGMYMSVASPNYAVTFYEEASSTYFMINGTFTRSGNDVAFRVVSSACPAYTNGETFNMKFAQLAGSLALREDGDPDLLLEKASFTSSQFVSATLGGGYSMGCF